MKLVGAELLEWDPVDRAVRLDARLVKVRTVSQAREAVSRGLYVVTRAFGEIDPDADSILRSARAFAEVVPADRWVGHIAFNEPNHPNLPTGRDPSLFEGYLDALTSAAARGVGIPWATPPLVPYHREAEYWQIIRDRISAFRVVCSHHYFNDAGEMRARLSAARAYAEAARTAGLAHVVDECNRQGLATLEDLLEFVALVAADAVVVFAMTADPNWAAYDLGDGWERVFALSGPGQGADSPTDPPSLPNPVETSPASPPITPPPGPNPWVLAVDSSRPAMSGPWGPAEFDSLAAQSVELVIIGVFHYLGGRVVWNEFALPTLRAAAEAGFLVGTYWGIGPGLEPNTVVRATKALLGDLWPRLSVAAVDAEVEGLTAEEVARWLRAVAGQGQIPWLYTSPGFYSRALAGLRPADAPPGTRLWVAHWGAEPGRPLGIPGWPEPDGHQYRGTTELAPGLVVDLNVFRREALVQAQNDALKQELTTQLDAAWGHLQALKDAIASVPVGRVVEEVTGRADGAQAALAVVATRLRELGIID